MKSKSTLVLFHIIGCLIFLLLPLIIWPVEGGISEFFSDDRALRGYFSNIMILLFFYLTFYLLIPKLYFRKRYIFFVIILITCYFVIAFLPEIIMPISRHTGQGFEPGREIRDHHEGNRIFFKLGHNLVFFLAVVFFSLMIKINERLKRTEKEKLKAELSYFKAQINPHFLFNTLNTIYSLAIQKADNTPEAVVKLSGMMRYVLTDASQDFVPLENELAYIHDYIELQKIRFGETVKIEYSSDAIKESLVIAPLILIPFIENAFKFGVNPAEESAIAVTIRITDSEIHLRVFNKKVNEKPENETSGGLGISNAKNRLALHYPNKHRLLLEDQEHHFEVNLYIELV